MFGKRVKLFSLLGFDVYVDASWLFLAVLVAWTLADGLFPYYSPGLSTATYWWMSVIGVVGLFLSIVLHETSHSVVARRYGIPMRGITLFIFGGVAEMHREPPSAKAEFLMAIAGPVMSYILLGVFWVLAVLAGAAGSARSLVIVLEYLAWMNGLLATFNLIPAFPLDGGRVFRAALWQWKKNLRWSTRIASRVGGIFGFVLMGLGVVAFFTGNFIGGIWWFMIGLFLRGASSTSYRQLLMKQALEGETIDRFMNKDPVTVSSSTTVQDLVDRYVYEYHFKMFPVVDDGRLVGCVTTQDIKTIPRGDWTRRTVRDIASPCDDDNTISPDADAMAAFRTMSRGERSRLVVARGDQLAGVIALKDLMTFITLKLHLEAGRLGKRNAA